MTSSKKLAAIVLTNGVVDRAGCHEAGGIAAPQHHSG